MRTLTILALALASFIAHAQMRHYLVTQWRSGADLMCKYGDGSVLNVGYRVCPLSVGGEPPGSNQGGGFIGGYTAAEDAKKQRELMDAERRLLEAQTRAMQSPAHPPAAAPSGPPTPAINEALMKCLQTTAAAVRDLCEKKGCEKGDVTPIIAEAQKMHCGYTALN